MSLGAGRGRRQKTHLSGGVEKIYPSFWGFEIFFKKKKIRDLRKSLIFRNARFARGKKKRVRGGKRENFFTRNLPQKYQKSRAERAKNFFDTFLTLMVSKISTSVRQNQ